MKNSCLFLFLALLLTSCGNQHLHQESVSLDPQGWAFADSLRFEFEIEDTTKLYSLGMDISHTTEFPYQNIYFMVGTEFPSGKKLRQQLSSDLADKSGKWYGECNAKRCSANINLQGKAKFKEPGKHAITVAQFSRDSALVGVERIGFFMDVLE